MAPARTTKRNVSQSQTQSQSQLSQLQSQALVDPKLKGLPEAFTAWANGWDDVTDENVGYSIEREDDFKDHELGRSLIETLIHIKEFTTIALTRRALPVESVYIFEHLVGDALSKIVDYTTTRLVDKKKPPTSPHEYSEFLATRILRSRI